MTATIKGEAMSTTDWPKKARDITATDLGQTVTFRTIEGAITGILSEVEHRAQLISERQFGDETERFAVGEVRTYLTLAGWGSRHIAGGTEISRVVPDAR